MMEVLCVFFNVCGARIMKYMGDYPSKKMRLGTDLTDQVFEYALVHVSHQWSKAAKMVELQKL